MTAIETQRSIRVIGDLITTDLHTAGSDPISKVAALWEKNPAADGMAVLDDDRARYLSRARFFVKLGKRFGYSLFENRPVAILAEEGSTVEADMDPVEVISIATQREADRVYDDIIVLEKRRFRGLVSMRSLLVHHKTLLANGIAERHLLEQQNRHLEGLHRLQSQFVGALAQELRGPAGTMLGLARSLLADPAVDDRGLQTIRGLVRCAQDALGTVDDLQDLLRLERGTLVPVPETISLRQLVEAIAAQAEPSLADRNLKLEMVLPERLEEVRTDPLLIRRILVSLLMAYLDRATEACVTLHAGRVGSAVEFTVSGRGGGLSDDELHELDSRTTWVMAGQPGRSALRLAALRGLLIALGGSVHAAIVGAGDAGVRVRIPLS